MNSTIEGVKVIPLRRIPDERGTISHMLRKTDPHFIEFGEIYFSNIYKDAIKAWHIHEKMTLNYTCIQGMIKLVIFDDRGSSPTNGNLMEIFMGDDNYVLVQIPPNVWNGHKGITDSLIANCATHTHDPSFSKRLDPHSDKIPYDWARVDK